eukprot:scaffold504_cov240-Pinguiococcus_pyrenoidosus.AAC.1
MFRVRLLCHAHEKLFEDLRGLDKEEDAVQTMIAKRVRLAQRRRLALQIPSSETNAYRLCNGEGDRLSGLVVDVLGPKHVVVSSSSLWCEIHKQSILAGIQQELGGGVELIWRSSEARLAQDGFNEVFDEEDAQEDAQEDDADASGGEGSDIVISELGFKYYANPTSGQKTGFYCDQRENREFFGKLVQPGARVADLCCFCGSFSMHAARAGAASVTAVDSSAAALELAARNAELNGDDFAQRISFVKDDVSKWMSKAQEVSLPQPICRS